VRLEQLVLFGPSDDFRIRFGPGVTVLAGLEPEERSELLTTLAEAMTGRLPNASVVYVDPREQRVFADRTGATYAASGAPAPTLTSLFGTDPAVVTRLITLTEADLGVAAQADQVSAESLESELNTARASLEEVGGEHAEAADLVAQLDESHAELASIDQRIDRSEDEGARWTWLQLRRDLDRAGKQLSALDDTGATDGDVRLLEAVEELRSTGASWAESSALAAELSARLGAVPDVSEDDLTTVAETPDAVPAGFTARVTEWQAAIDQRCRREAEVCVAAGEVAEPADELVGRLAAIDQQTLWTAHGRLMAAQAVRDLALGDYVGEADPEIELTIEAAHLDVLRCERVKHQRFLPGMLGSAALAVAALLAGATISVFVGIAALIGAVALAWWQLVIPRRDLAEATREEEMALGRADAGSWLGLHLRRIDDVVLPADRGDLDAANDRLATARLDWEELLGDIDPDEVGERRDAIAAHAAALDPVAREACERSARIKLDLAVEDELTSRAAVTAGLESYGVSGEGPLDLEPNEVLRVLQRRVDAGRYARDIQLLRLHSHEASDSAALLDRLLADLGFTDGDLEERLDVAIEAVAAARNRNLSVEEQVDRAELEAQVIAMTERLASTQRRSWDETPEPTSEPVDPDLLLARLREVAEAIAAGHGPDLVDAERRLGIAHERVSSLEGQLLELGAGPQPRDEHLHDRVFRTVELAGVSQTLPIVVDEVLDRLTPVDQLEVLDLMAHLSCETQVIVLSANPMVATWARSQVAGGDVTLFEADAAISV